MSHNISNNALSIYQKSVFFFNCLKKCFLMTIYWLSTDLPNEPCIFVKYAFGLSVFFYSTMFFASNWFLLMVFDKCVCAFFFLEIKWPKNIQPLAILSDSFYFLVLKRIRSCKFILLSSELELLLPDSFGLFHWPTFREILKENQKMFSP